MFKHSAYELNYAIFIYNIGIKVVVLLKQIVMMVKINRNMEGGSRGEAHDIL